MALPPPSPRKLSHTRTVVYSGFEREDGLNIRLTVDNDFKIHDLITDMAHIPHPECERAPLNMHKLVGCTLGAGWRKTIDAHLGGVAGCTHLREMLFNMATAAYQTIPSARQFKAQQAGLPDEVPTTPPPHVGKCMSWAFDGPVVERYYPMFFRKPEAA